jgi:hemerythrin-like domain-containing protein
MTSRDADCSAGGIPIGGAEPASDPATMLRTCHDKIRRFMRSAARLASDEPAPPDDVRETARALVRYFREALPRHAEDEDLSLRPRLERAGYEGPLDRLAVEHAEIDARLEPLMRRWEELAGDPARRAAHAIALAVPTSELADLFERHLAWEEEHLLPRLEDLLGRDALAEVGAEMRARRAKGPKEA